MKPIQEKCQNHGPNLHDAIDGCVTVVPPPPLCTKPLFCQESHGWSKSQAGKSQSWKVKTIVKKCQDSRSGRSTQSATTMRLPAWRWCLGSKRAQGVAQTVLCGKRQSQDGGIWAIPRFPFSMVMSTGSAVPNTKGTRHWVALVSSNGETSNPTRLSLAVDADGDVDSLKKAAKVMFAVQLKEVDACDLKVCSPSLFGSFPFLSTNCTKKHLKVSALTLLHAPKKHLGVSALTLLHAPVALQPSPLQPCLP